MKWNLEVFIGYRKSCYIQINQYLRIGRHYNFGEVPKRTNLVLFLKGMRSSYLFNLPLFLHKSIATMQITKLHKSFITYDKQSFNILIGQNVQLGYSAKIKILLECVTG
jgi:hypothetical protein